ncbi:MAG: hypothetical protein IAF94_17035 [Pirellulaceae bacterium]|nr:hypothetical protein [Pirellulaceae bacterium]
MNTIDFGERTQLWLDRLACGELDELTRTNLFAWLDAEPLRWRGCALACLEAQTWNESLGQLSTGHNLVQEPHAELVGLGAPRSVPASPVSILATMAALLLVAFGLGAFARGWMDSQSDAIVTGSQQPAKVESTGPLMATVSLTPGLGSSISGKLQIPVAARNSAAESLAPSNISEYDRQKWERRGYQLIKERRFLPAELPSGQKVVVPVEQVKASYIGSKVS